MGSSRVDRIRVSPWLGRAAIALALLVFFGGWALQISALRNLIPGTPVTTPVTAVLLFLIGVSVATASGNPGWISRTGLLCCGAGLLTVLISGWVLLEYLFAGLPQVESLMFVGEVRKSGSDLPGCPSPHSAVAFLLLGLAAIFSHRRGSRFRVVSLATSSLGAMVAWTVLLGYAAEANPLYEMRLYEGIGMSPVTALGLLLAYTGIITMKPDEGLPGLLHSRTAGGSVARRILPLSLGLPVVMAWLMTWWLGTHPGSHGPAVVIAMAFNSVIICGLILWLGFELDRRERERQRMAAELQRKVEQLDQLRNGLVTVCAWTGKVLDGDEWVKFEDYLKKHLGVNFSHGISEEAAAEQMRALEQNLARGKSHSHRT